MLGAQTLLSSAQIGSEFVLDSALHDTRLRHHNVSN